MANPNSPSFNYASPIGRFVAGDPFTMSDRDNQGQLRVYKNGPKVGQPKPECYLALAVPKLIHGQPNGDWASFEATLRAFGRHVWPNLFDPVTGQCTRQDFAWKIQDGDSTSFTGVKLWEKEGYAGHWIINFGSSFLPEVVVKTGPDMYAEIKNPEHLKRGFYVRVGGTIKSNDSAQRPGLYINLSKVELIGEGPVITSGATASQVFGAAPAAFIPEGMGAINPATFAGVATGVGQPQPQSFAPQGQPQGGGFAPQPQGQPQQQFAPPAGGFAPQPAPQPQQQFAPQPQQQFAPPPVQQAGFQQPQPGAFAPTAGPQFPPVGQAGTFAPGATTSHFDPNAQPQQQFAPAPAPAPAPQPHSGFMGGPPVMLPKAGATTYDAFIAAGWTEANMIADGYMAAR